MGGTTWGPGSFETNGEQIYFTGVNKNGERIPYLDGPGTGMMMGGYLSCASCHGPDGQGGEHFMHMEVMNAPDIRWESLQHEEEEEHAEGDGHEGYDIDLFRKAVVDRQHPDGAPLSRDMPRWQMSDGDLEDLVEYLKSLP
jgi:mono/diheme cytochrome c family protein